MADKKPLDLEAMMQKAKLWGLLPLNMDPKRAEMLRAKGIDPDTAGRIYGPAIPDAVVMDCEQVVETLEEIKRMQDQGIAETDHGYKQALVDLNMSLTKVKYGATGTSAGKTQSQLHTALAVGKCGLEDAWFVGSLDRPAAVSTNRAR